MQIYFENYFNFIPFKLKFNDLIFSTALSLRFGLGNVLISSLGVPSSYSKMNLR